MCQTWCWGSSIIKFFVFCHFFIVSVKYFELYPICQIYLKDLYVFWGVDFYNEYGFLACCHVMVIISLVKNWIMYEMYINVLQAMPASTWLVLKILYPQVYHL